MSLAEITEKWNFDDLMMANEVLDAIEGAEAQALEEAHG